MAGSQLPEGETVKDSEQVGLPHGVQRAVALEHPESEVSGSGVSGDHTGQEGRGVQA